MWAHSHPHMYPYVHTQTHTCLYAHMDPHMCPYVHIHRPTHVPRCRHTHTALHMYPTHVPTCAHTPPYVHTHVLTCAPPQTCMQTPCTVQPPRAAHHAHPCTHMHSPPHTHMAEHPTAFNSKPSAAGAEHPSHSIAGHPMLGSVHCCAAPGAIQGSVPPSCWTLLGLMGWRCWGCAAPRASCGDEGQQEMEHVCSWWCWVTDMATVPSYVGFALLNTSSSSSSSSSGSRYS